MTFGSVGLSWRGAPGGTGRRQRTNRGKSPIIHLIGHLVPGSRGSSIRTQPTGRAARRRCSCPQPRKWTIRRWLETSSHPFMDTQKLYPATVNVPKVVESINGSWIRDFILIAPARQYSCSTCTCACREGLTHPRCLVTGYYVAHVERGVGLPIPGRLCATTLHSTLGWPPCISRLVRLGQRCRRGMLS